MNDLVVGLACEDRGHASVATHLVDASLLSAHAWLDGILASCRCWRGLNEGEEWYKYDPSDALDVRPWVIDGQRIAPQGHIDGAPLEPEAGMWRKILLLFCHTRPQPKVVILVRDLDGYAKRRSGLMQVRDRLRWPFKVVVATPQPEVEAWRVAGFVANSEDERRRLEAIRRELSFDPTVESHRLTSHPNDAPTDAKRVLARLCGDDEERREACLPDCSRLRTRGGPNWLTEFLDKIDEDIVPFFGPHQ